MASPPTLGSPLGPADVLLLQQTAGNASVQRLLRGGLLQRMTIGGEYYAPTGQKAKTLWGQIRVMMIQNQLSPHGAKKRFTEKLGSNDPDPGGVQQFVQAFVHDARTEAQRVVQAKAAGQKGRGWTRALKLNRPPWPKGYGGARGTEIRHVVRNALIRDALLGELKHYQAQNVPDAQIRALLERDFGPVIGTLRIPQQITAWELVNQLYRGLYLHPKNLFVGAGGVNEVIGLSADNIAAVSLAAASSNGPMTEDEVREGIQKVWDEAAVAEQKSLAKLEKMPAEARNEFLKGLDVYFDTLDTFLGEREQEWLKQLPTRKEVANEFQDIADNFSFDFILEESGLSQEEIARRQAVLVQVDTALKAHQAGATGNLGKIFAYFLS